jgi:hypothetical protein
LIQPFVDNKKRLYKYTNNRTNQNIHINGTQ